MMKYFSIKGDLNEPLIFKDLNKKPFFTMQAIPKNSESADDNHIYAASEQTFAEIKYIIEQKFGKDVNVFVYNSSAIENTFSDFPIIVDPSNNLKNIIIESNKKNLNICFFESFGQNIADASTIGNGLRELFKDKKTTKGKNFTFSSSFRINNIPAFSLGHSIFKTHNALPPVLSIRALRTFDAVLSFENSEINITDLLGVEFTNSFFPFDYVQFQLLKNKAESSNKGFKKVYLHHDFENNEKLMQESKELFEHSKLTLLASEKINDYTINIPKNLNYIDSILLASICDCTLTTNESFKALVDSLKTFRDVSPSIFLYSPISELSEIIKHNAESEKACWSNNLRNEISPERLIFELSNNEDN